jgi:hypothetical protein
MGVHSNCACLRCIVNRSILDHEERHEVEAGARSEEAKAEREERETDSTGSLKCLKLTTRNDTLRIGSRQRATGSPD